MAITREIAKREEQMRIFEAFARRIAADPNSLLHKMVLIEHQRQQREAEVADTFQAPGAILPAIEKALAVTNHYDDYRNGGEPTRFHAGGLVGAFDAPLMGETTSEVVVSHQGLPVAGYKKDQPAWAVGLVNQNKVLEEAVLRQLDHLKVKYSADVDQRQVALARTKLEEDFYHMNRAVFQPQRILSGPVSAQAAEILIAAGSRAGATEPDFAK